MFIILTTSLAISINFKWRMASVCLLPSYRWLLFMRINRYAKHWEQCPSYWVIRLCVKLYYFLVSNRDLKWKVLLCIIIWLIYYNCTHESSETIFILNKCIISLKKQTVSNYFHRTINRFQFRLINHHQYLLLSSIYWI